MLLAARRVMSTASRRLAVLEGQIAGSRALSSHSSHGSSGTSAGSSASGGASSSAGTTAAADDALHSSAAAAADSTPQSFIARVKTHGVNSILGLFLSSGTRFDRCLEGMRVTAIRQGHVTAELEVTDALQNSYATLHGGAIATIVDVVGTMALLTMDPLRAGVSVDLNVTYLAAAKAGESIVAHGTVLKTGKKLGFAQVDIRRKADGKLLATGRHTKAL
jgi:acyl-coenzyme A thioesterase 13